jgi:CRISPR-associated protein (TIGR02584 family)
MCNSTDGYPYARRILLVITGLTPQVVTETVCALAQAREPLPTEIHVLSTARGRDEAWRKLLSEEPGWFRRLCRDYALPPIAFDEDCLHVLEDALGRPLDDIRTPENNARAADGITERIRHLTEDPACQLHVSLAGGRKTMGFLAGYALSLFGRPQDRLSHVLVSPPYESLPDFFYPTPYPLMIPMRDEKQIDAQNAEVTLADIPFLRLRHSLPDNLLTGAARFSEIVQNAQQALGPPELRIDYAKLRLIAGGVAVRMPPADLAFYGWLARRALEGREPVRRPGKKDVPDDRYTEEFLAEYRRMSGDPEVRERTLRAMSRGMETTWFDDRLNSVHRRIREALNYAAAPYLIADSGRRPKHYRLALRPQQIHFV